MKDLNWKNGDLFEKFKCLKIELQNIQQLIDRQPFNMSLREIGVLLLEQYNADVIDEERFLYQKARIDRLRDGDRNSAFFHKTIKGRLYRSKVRKICTEQGDSFEGEDVAKQFVEHFTKFLGTTYSIKEFRDPTSLFQRKISNEEALQMTAEISDEEIKQAMFGIGDNKAPRPDWYTAKSYKSTWGIIGTDIYRAVKQFFQDGIMTRGVNATTIALVPKLDTP